FAIVDRDRNLARVDVPVVGQRVAGVFPDAFVGTRVAGRALPAITLPAITGAAIAALAAAVVVIIVGKPAGDGLGRAVEPIALVVRAPGPAIVTVLAARRRAVIAPFAVIGREPAARAVSARVTALVGEARGAEIASPEIVAGEARVPRPFGAVAAGAAIGRGARVARAIARVAAPVAAGLPLRIVAVAGFPAALVVVAPGVVHLTGAPVVVAPAIVGLELFGLAALVAFAVVALAVAVGSVCHGLDPLC